MKKDKFGLLIGEINKLFEVFSNSLDQTFLRKGVTKSKNSLLECVLEGVNDDVINMEDEDDIIQYLNDVREDLGRDVMLCNSAKQEMYDYSAEQIREYLLDPSKYLDPKLMISLLERKYNCNIFVFNRYGFKSGTLVKPRYLQNYYRYVNTERPNIFIYEHLGSTSDHAFYPRCELIVAWNTGTSDISGYNFSDDDFITIKVKEIYNKLLKSYALNVEIHQINFPLKLSEDMVQGFDSYGKTRLIKVSFNSQIVTILFNGIPPLILNETKDIIPTLISYEQAIQFCSQYSIIVTGRTNKTLLGLIGNVKLTIPIFDSPKHTDSIPLFEGKQEIFPLQKESALDNYNKYKKLTRYISEYLFWMFSYFVKDIEGDLETRIVPFIQQYTVVQPDFEYGEIGKFFTMDSPLLLERKLVVKSNETLKRLVYSLRLALRNNRKKIKLYHNKITIENFYMDLSDFDQYPAQVIIYGENTIEKWLNNQMSNHKIYNSIQSEITSPYFFMNSLISPNIYLTQNTVNLSRAKEIGKNWKNDGYNLGLIPGENLETLQFTFYAYQNEEQIIKYNVTGEENTYDIKIVGFKVEEEIFFAVLMDL